MNDLQRHVHDRLVAALAALGLEGERAEAGLLLQPPKNREHGDVALGCFVLAKELKRPPPALAQQLASAIGPDEVIESAAAAGPFVNFRFQRSALARLVVSAVLSAAPPYGPAPARDYSVVIDFSSPNIAKPFHIGHMRSTVIGAALCRIHRHAGHVVHGINHLGDWGMPFAKVMTAYMHWGDEAELHRNPMRHVFELYKKYVREVQSHPELDEEAARHFRNLEAGGDNEERRMWQLLRDESLRAFQGPYDRLNVAFDHITGESFFEDKMQDAMARVEAAGILTESEGAVIVDLKDRGIDVPCLLRKSDGTTLYHTRDLAAAFWREEHYRPDRLLYVVGSEQKLHFDQLVAVLAKMGSPLAERIEHVPFGLVMSRNPETGKWEKFASRTGNAVFLDELLDEAVANVRRIIQEKNPDLEDPETVAEQVGVSAIVFNDLKNSRVKDVKFDWEAMLNFDGETGPYVQYACARLAGILRKAGRLDEPVDLDRVEFGRLADAEKVLLTMLDFGPAVQRACDQSEPSIITGLMIAVAGEIHSYLREHHVLGAEPETREARLALVAAARKMLQTGLGLLGIPAPDRM